MVSSKRVYNNEIYSLVDENYLSNFKSNHLPFMKSFYYEVYLHFCNSHSKKPLSEDAFYVNMRRRRIQLYQLCCPYCGTVAVSIHDKRIQKEAGTHYCFHCGRGSTAFNLWEQLSRFQRIARINTLGLKAMQKERPEQEEWIMGYDCYQMEIIEMASIIEVVFRDYFEALMHICNFGVKSDYIRKIVRKHTANDFMNIEKASDNFKKAFGIDIRANLDEHIWNNLVDIVNMRNMMVHNNGIIDEKFKRTKTYQRVKDKSDGRLLKLEKKDIDCYFADVVLAVAAISNLYLKIYYEFRNVVVANYYFNDGFSEKDDNE